MSFIRELKRRNVVRVATAYAVVAWLIAQIAALALESFGAPDWVIKSVLFLLIAGFPLALVLAWAFELTPEGIRRDSSDKSVNRPPASGGRLLDVVIIVALALAVAYLGYDRFLHDDTKEQPESTNNPAESLPGSGTSPDTADEPEQMPPSVAVLPFINISDDPGNEYFAEGLSEELLTLLANVPGLKVAARTSSFAFKGSDAQIDQIAEELNVTHVLEGSVRKSGDTVRITVQLIDASNGFHVYSEKYDRSLDDIFAVQDEIASSIVTALQLKVLGTPEKATVTNPEVFSLYLKARYLNNLKGRENWENAVVALHKAIAIDPEYAPAWSELSTTYRFQSNNNMRDPIDGMGLAREAAEQALALDGNLASAWVSLSYALSLGDWDWDGAADAMEHAKRLDPLNVDVLNGEGNIAIIHGQIDAAIHAFKRAVELDPLNQSAQNSLGLAYMYAGRFDEAKATFRVLLQLNPGYPWGYANLGTVMLLDDQPEIALETIRKNPENSLRSLVETLTLITLQQDDAKVAQFTQSADQHSPFWAAQIHAWRNDTDRAFESLKRAVESRSIGLAYILASPYLVSLHSDTRWVHLLERIGLLDAYRAMSSR
jgi:adenylate cyclase